jgi:hypothetical protein
MMQSSGFPRSHIAALVLFISLLSTSFSARAAEAPAGDFFPLMAWDYATNEKVLEEMSACGINSVAFVPPEMLDACAKHKLQAIVFDESISGKNWNKPFDGDQAVKNLPALVEKVNGHPAVYGYHLKDEPGPHEYEALAKAVAKLKELAPGKWPYINLLPGDGPDYEKYLEGFLTICRPTVLSYDRYVLAEGGAFDSGFWTNLASTRQAALKHSVPLHNIVLTAPHWGYRELTAVDMRLQVWGSLVYGVKGLAYYKFCSESLPILDAPDLGNFRAGPLDEIGQRTPTFAWMRSVNHQVTQLAPTLLKLKSDDVYHLGEAPNGNHGVTETSLVKRVGQPTEFVIGDFTHDDGSRWVMIVNKSLHHSYPCVPEFRQPPKAIEYVDAISGKLKPFPAPYFFLAPGQGVLLKLN